jgi:hypothetical protein
VGLITRSVDLIGFVVATTVLKLLKACKRQAEKQKPHFDLKCGFFMSGDI